MKVLGIDPSLRNFGFCLTTVNNNKIITIDELHLEKTTAPPKKHKGYVNEWDLATAQTLTNALHKYIPKAERIYVEVPVGSQSAAAMKSYGVCIGILGNIYDRIHIVRPNDIKKCTTGNDKATKNEMIEWATNMFPEAPWLRASNGRILNSNEHLADALGAIYTGLQLYPIMD